MADRPVSSGRTTTSTDLPVDPSQSDADGGRPVGGAPGRRPSLGDGHAPPHRAGPPRSAPEDGATTPVDDDRGQSPDDPDETSAWPPIRRLGDEGRYHLEEPIAAGGAATVWRAYDVHLGRSVAIKILHPHLVADGDTVRRFERESRNAARLHHPNATRIYDSGRVNDVVYLVMEYVDGPTLKTLMRTHGAFPDPRQVAAIGEQIADALAEAHAQGLIHRDIKPANILFNSDGVVKVADFGIAKALSQTTVDLTAEGTTVGSATYIAPEQYAGGEVDARADIYALGVVMYECLTGSPAFSGDTATATAAARLTREVRPPRQIRADIDRRLDDVVVRSTRRDPRDRYDNVASVAHALQSSLRGTPAKELTSRLMDETAPDAPRVPNLPDEVDPDAATDPSMPTGGKRLFRIPAAWAFLAGVLLTAVILVLVNRDDAPPPALETEGALTIASGSDYDPFGDGSENPDQVPFLWDNNQATTWSSDSYRAPADQPFGDNQPGVGLVFELESRSQIDQLVVLSEEPGLDLDLYVAENLPDDIDRVMGWGTPVRSAEDLGRSAVLNLDEPAIGRWALVWLTGLPEIEPSLQRARIAEIQLRGEPVPAEADTTS